MKLMFPLNKCWIIKTVRINTQSLEATNTNFDVSITLGNIIDELVKNMLIVTILIDPSKTKI